MIRSNHGYEKHCEADRGGKSELTLRQTGFPSVHERDGHKLGWDSTLDRLAEYLAGADL